MKTLIRIIPALAALALCAGCSTPSARISRNPSAFARCTPAQQELIRQGLVAPGFDREMVSLALGNPDRVTEITDAAGRSEVWHYEAYVTEDEVVFYGGYGHRRFRGPWIYAAYPVGYPVRRGYDHFRILFKDGKVVSIEEET